MELEYVNRQQQKYFLHQGRTKTGKPKYYASMKNGVTKIDQMPEGYEFYEDPQHGLVTVRKMKPSRILAEERLRLEAWIREFAKTEYFIVEIKDDSLIVHTPGDDIESAVAEWTREGFGLNATALRSRMASRATYMPMFRFRLVDEDKRDFSADRWCYRGSIDSWISLMGRDGSLEAISRKYLPHLMLESFFELM